MRNITAFFLTFAFCTLSYAYKFLVYAPQTSHSHVNFLGKVADTLVAAGHEVVVYLPEFDPDVKTNGSKLARILHRKRDFELSLNTTVRNLQDSAWIQKSESLGEVLHIIKLMTRMQIPLCEKMLHDEVQLEQLRSEKFDLGISEAISYCGLLLFDKIGIKAHIGASAVNLIEGITEHFGAINNPSFVPTLFNPTSDIMSYTDRVKSLLTYLVSRYIIEFIAKPVTYETVRRNMPPSYNFLKNSVETSFVFVNADEFLEFSRPISHKIVYVGGIAVPKPKELSKEYAKIMDSAKDGAVLISFGSIAKSSLMSNDTKEAFVEAFKKFPKVKFIWKYEIEDDIAANLPNVYKKTWVPQNDLLNHPNMRAFVSHGGLNSLTESVHAGVPIICIPLFGDQMRNAKMIEKRKVGIILDKTQLDSKAVVDAISTILKDKKYATDSRRLAQMIAEKPIPAKERVVKYAEFAAKFGRLPNLTPASVYLNFFQYYLLDIILPVFVLLILFIVLQCKIALMLIKRLLRWRKAKTD